jgi:hypothetical protein
MMGRHADGARLREIALAVAVAALDERHEQERDEENRARETQAALAQSVHRVDSR